MNDYDVRLYRSDNTLSLIIKTAPASFAEIEQAAWAMLRGNIVRAEVWREHRRVAVVASLMKP